MRFILFLAKGFGFFWAFEAVGVDTSGCVQVLHVRGVLVLFAYYCFGFNYCRWDTVMIFPCVCGLLLITAFLTDVLEDWLTKTFGWRTYLVIVFAFFGGPGGYRKWPTYAYPQYRIYPMFDAAGSVCEWSV